MEKEKRLVVAELMVNDRTTIHRSFRGAVCKCQRCNNGDVGPAKKLTEADVERLFGQSLNTSPTR